MKRHIVSLVLILLIQIVLIATLYWPGIDRTGAASTKALLPADPNTIDEIYVEDEHGAEAVLLKMSGRWILPDLSGVPVKTVMVERLVDTLVNSSGRQPVATTAASRQRFQVAAYRYQRRITLIRGGELLATVYLGTSPGFRKVYARNDAQEAIYSIDFSNFEAPADASDWLDKSLAQVERPERISGPDFKIELNDGAWISELGSIPDQRELAALVLGLNSLKIEGVASEDQLATLGFTAPALTFAIESPDGTVKLFLYTIGERHFLRSSRYDYFFTLSSYDFDRLAGIDGALLQGSKPQPANDD